MEIEGNFIINAPPASALSAGNLLSADPPHELHCE